MKIEMHDVTIRELVDGYRDEGDDGVFGYGGRLDIRPPYQREFVYDEKKRMAVVDSIMNGFPLNVMYWVARADGGYEVMDGQQRTVSIGQFFSGDFCGRKFALEEMHADHVKPWCRGGQTTLENGQMLCHDCNWTKGKR